MIKESAYSVKSVSVDAVIACVLGSLSILSMAGAILASYLYNGSGPAAVGLLGIGSFIMSVMGIVFTVYAWKSVDGGLLMKRIGGILNAIPFAASIVFYVVGWL